MATKYATVAPIQKSLLPVAQAFYSAGYPVCGADYSVYSLERNDLIMRVRVAFSASLSNDAFPELPTRCGVSQGIFDGVEYCCVESDVLYLAECGEMLCTKHAARRKATKTLYDYAMWLENSGMAAILILQGKL